MQEAIVTPLEDPVAGLTPSDPVFMRAPLAAQLATLTVIVLPFFGLLAAPLLLWGWGFNWVDFGLLVGFYVLTTMGVTVGFHRLFTHAAFETKGWIKSVLAVSGSLAIEGPLFQWVAMHRKHHQHSDKKLDPHSPHHHGNGLSGLLKGACHAHMGWFFEKDHPNLERLIPDLRKSRALCAISALFPLWLALSFLLPAVLGGLITGTWRGVLTGFIWGGLVRIFLVHHVTWSINSACHMWGPRPYETNDLSRNNPLFGILAMGEGWHNSHHAFPSSARHGLRWWQPDLSYEMIRLLRLTGLAWNVKLPSAEAQMQKTRSPKPRDSGRRLS
jgi:stearoyl-CoA desaturase (Delta-9 desaturase)